MASPDNQLFGRLCLHYKLLTRDQLVDALQQQSREGGRRRIGEILVENGLLTAERFAQLLEIQRSYEAKLREPSDGGTPEPVASTAARPATPVPPSPPTGLPTTSAGADPSLLTPREASTDLLRPNGGGLPTTAGAPRTAEPSAPAAVPAPPVAPAPVAAPAEPVEVAGGSIGSFLRLAVERRASDLHVHAGVPLRLRIDGDFVAVGEEPLTPERSAALVDELLTEEQRAELAERGQIDFAYTLEGVGRFRANAFRQQRGTDVVLRVIPAVPPSLDDLGLPLDLARFVNHHQGLVLLTGPTGCGKSSTLAALIRIVNEERRDHVITIEDPIEFVHRPQRCVINQRQVGGHTRSFSRALRAALREDPDVIVVGELRDLETISLALTAAETGHLVLATLHTMNAINTINRLIGVFPPEQQSQIRTMVSESLRAIVSQRLVRRADGGGRAAALEVLVCNKAVANLVRESKTFQIRSVLQTGGGQGMRSLDTSLAELLKHGTITAEEARRNAEDPKKFASGPPRPTATPDAKAG